MATTATGKNMMALDFRERVTHMRLFTSGSTTHGEGNQPTVSVSQSDLSVSGNVLTMASRTFTIEAHGQEQELTVTQIHWIHTTGMGTEYVIAQIPVTSNNYFGDASGTFTVSSTTATFN